MTPAQLGVLLRELYEDTDEGLRRDYQRSLSFDDGLFDRWQRAKRLGFGDKASIYNSALVYGDVRVGEEVWIGPYVLLDGSSGELSIGAFCNISAGVQVYTHDTVMRTLSAGKKPKNEGPVSIGACTYIGSQSIVAAGTTIGDQCVVAANSFVNRDVPDRTIVGGSPARPLGRVVVEGDDIRFQYANSTSAAEATKS